VNPIERLKIFRRKFLEGNNYPIRRGVNGTFIFIYINKTAGTSIAKCIGLPKKRHLTVKEVIQIVGQQNFNNAFKFSVVRNPWSKVFSHYKYRVRTNQTELGECQIPFRDWVAKTYGTDKDLFYYNTPKMFMPQVEWLRDKNDSIAVDEIIKFEQLSDSFQKVANIIGIEYPLPQLNQTNKTDYREYYDSVTKKIIETHFEEDIDLFKYSF